MYEGHGLKKFKGKFNFTPSDRGLIKKDVEAGDKV
jgi:hypothetical protein